jgi:hypothetical protein
MVLAGFTRRDTTGARGPEGRGDIMPTPTQADLDLILGWLAEYEQGAPWTPISGHGPWFTTATLIQLIKAGRVTIEQFRQVQLHGALDGQPVVYVMSLFGIIDPRATQLVIEPSA